MPIVTVYTHTQSYYNFVLHENESDLDDLEEEKEIITLPIDMMTLLST